jgi:hypothetical protein
MAATSGQILKLGTHTRRARRKVAASVRLYEGTLCFLIAASGFATNVIASGANRFGGVIVNDANNSSGGNGDVETEAVHAGLVTLVGATHSLVLADIGKLLYASDNHTLTVTSTNNVLIGMLHDIDANGNAVVELKAF